VVEAELRTTLRDQPLQRARDHARPADADVDDGFRLADAVDRARHERIVFRLVGEDDELGRGEPAPVCALPAEVVDDLAHEPDCVHVDAVARRADVDRRAHLLRADERLRDRGDEFHVPAAQPALHVGRETADEVHAHLSRGLVERVAERGEAVPVEPRADVRDGSDREALVDHGQAILVAHRLACGDEPLGLAAHLVPDRGAGRVHVARVAVQQVQAEGDRAHVEVLFLDHGDRAENLFGANHTSTSFVARKMASCWSTALKPACSPNAFSRRRRSSRSPQRLTSTSSIMM